MKHNRSDSKKNVLICPLDWGLGHASRDIYIIHKLLETNNFNVIIAADKAPYYLLKSEFPELQFIKFPSFTISYSRSIPLVLKIIFSFPKMLIGYFREHKMLKPIIKKYNIDIAISDNRYGLWNKKITTVFITHQLRVIFPKSIKCFESLFFKISTQIIQKFDFCWVPDVPGDENLAGKLSHPKKIPGNSLYIGLLSRFLIEKYQNPKKQVKKFDVLVILSGPEPQRSVLEKIIIRQFRNTEHSVLFVRGIPWKKQGQTIHNNIQLVSHLSADLLNSYLQNAKSIICRSGYSSVMDLTILGKTAIMIPTPGQTEQEYLAHLLAEKKLFVKADQNNLDFEKAIKEIEEVKTSFHENDSGFLDKAIKQLIDI